MILNAVIHGKRFYGESWPEMSYLITEVMENSGSEKLNLPIVSPGEDAWFSFSGEKHTEESDPSWPDNFLRVAVNKSTGYGGLIWFVDAERADRSGDQVSESIWISDNPVPPDVDPRVVADPGFPLFHDPRSTVTLAKVREALEEFCRTATGDRPKCVSWVRGAMNGKRIDEDH